MIVRFIDIGGIHVHHCLSFHFINEKKNKFKKNRQYDCRIRFYNMCTKQEMKNPSFRLI